MTFMISVGKYGGFYWHRKYTFRLCLGWVAFTFVPADIDDVLEVGLPIVKEQQRVAAEQALLAQCLDDRV